MVTNPPLLLSIDETCEQLRIGRSLLLQKIYAGEITSCRIGRRRLVSAAALSEYVAKLQPDAADREQG